MGLILIERPIAEPLSLDEVKAHLRVDGDDDDALISSLIQAARSALDGREGWLGRALMPQVWDLTLASLEGEIEIPLPPLRRVVSIHYLDIYGELEALPADAYLVDTSEVPGRVMPAPGRPWPATSAQANAVRIRFEAGYGPSPSSASDGGSGEEESSGMPEAIRQAMLLMIGHWYAHREAVNVGNIVTELPLGAKRLLASYRVWP